MREPELFLGHCPPCIVTTKPRLFVVVIHKVVGRSPTLPSKSFRHLREAFGLDQVVECKWWKHGAVSVYLCLYQQCSTAHAIELYDGPGVAVRDFWSHQYAFMIHACMHSPAM